MTCPPVEYGGDLMRCVHNAPGHSGMKQNTCYSVPPVIKHVAVLPLAIRNNSEPVMILMAVLKFI